MKKIIKVGLKVLIPLVLGGVILFWVYRDFDFSKVEETLLHQFDWFWFFVSVVAGVMSHVIRGWRWRLTLAPLGYFPKNNHCVYSIFIAYAANLVVPRVGEVSRCTVLSSYDGIPFTKSLGTVVTERIIDSLCVLLFTVLAFLLQGGVLVRFMTEAASNGAGGGGLAGLFFSFDFWLWVAVAIVLFAASYFLFRRFPFFGRVRKLFHDMWEGVMSLKRVKNPTLFIVETLAIWGCYFLQFYLCFFCFNFSSHLSLLAALLMFVAGSIAVVVPTPNGAGPWHFGIISIMVLYGVSYDNSAIFALIVHGTQTLLMVVLGVYALVMLLFEKKYSVLPNNKKL